MVPEVVPVSVENPMTEGSHFEVTVSHIEVTVSDES